MKPNQTTFKTILNKYGIAIVLLAMILFLSIVKPNFRTWDNLLNMQILLVSSRFKMAQILINSEFL